MKSSETISISEKQPGELIYSCKSLRISLIDFLIFEKNSGRKSKG
jgi:hypothetical protein